MTLLYALGLLLVALLLILLELFIPSGGLLGAAAVAALIGAVVVGFLHSFTTGGVIVLVISVLVPMVVTLALRCWPKTMIGRRILNVDPEEAQQRRDEQETQRRSLVGKVGKATMDMLPSGVVLIDQRRIDAISLGGVIERGEFVEVVNVVAGKVQVRKTARRPEPPPKSSDGDSPANAAAQQTEAPSDPLEVPIESLGIEDFDDPRQR